jgi:tetratricopeptide (TPR) repeat protein
MELIGRIVGYFIFSPIGNIICGALVSLVIGIPIYSDQHSLSWVFIGGFIAAIGIVRLILEYMPGGSSSSSQKPSNSSSSSSSNSDDSNNDNSMTANDYFEQGEGFMKRGAWSDAIKSWTKVISMQPNNGSAHYMRGLAYSNRGDYATSISDFTNAIRLVQSNADLALAYYNRGASHSMLKKVRKALEDFEMASKLDPNDRDAQEAAAKMRRFL